MKTKKKCVILGFGFGGLNFYQNLSSDFKKEYDIIVIDKRNYFLFTPLLHEVATGSLDSKSITEPIRHLLDEDTEFFQASISCIDPLEKKVYCESGGHQNYDILISSLGSRIHHFGIPGADTFTYSMKTLGDAVKLKNRIIHVFEDASKRKTREQRKQILSFVVVGAGPTGVEFAGELSDLIYGTMEKYYKNVFCLEDVSISLVNGGDKILKAFPEALQDYASKELQDKNVKIINGVRVQEVFEDSVLTSDGKKVFGNTIVWSAGVQGNTLPDKDIFDTVKGRIIVDEYFKLSPFKEVYAIGDMARFELDNGKALPTTAQIATMQGVHLAKNLNRQVLGKKALPFEFKEKGMLASLGRFSAIASVAGLNFYGVFAWFFWRSVYVFNFASWRKRVIIMFQWFQHLFTRRDITER